MEKAYYTPEDASFCSSGCGVLFERTPEMVAGFCECFDGLMCSGEAFLIHT